MPSLWSRFVRRKHRISSRKQERGDTTHASDQSVFIKNLEVRRANCATARNERENVASNETRPINVGGELKIRDTGSNEWVERLQTPENGYRKIAMPARFTEQGGLRSNNVESENLREKSDSDNMQSRLPILNNCGNSGALRHHASTYDDTYVKYITSRTETANSASPAWQPYSVPVLTTQKPVDCLEHESRIKNDKFNYVPKAVKMLDFTQILTGQFPGDQHFSEPDLRFISERTLVTSSGESFKISPTLETRHEYNPRHSREQDFGMWNRTSKIIPRELCPDFQGHNQTTSTSFNSNIYVEHSQLNDSRIPMTAISVLHDKIDTFPPASAAGSWERTNTYYSQLDENERMNKIGTNTEYKYDIAVNTDYDHYMTAASIDYNHQGEVSPLVSRNQRLLSMSSSTGHRESVTDPRDDQVTDADIEGVLAQLDKVTDDEQDNHLHQFLEGLLNQQEDVLY